MLVGIAYACYTRFEVLRGKEAGTLVFDRTPEAVRKAWANVWPLTCRSTPDFFCFETDDEDDDADEILRDQ